MHFAVSQDILTIYFQPIQIFCIFFLQFMDLLYFCTIDSCRIKVSEEAQKAMIKKLRQLQGNVPKYRIGRYDCTSFVMDIADAAGIRYGARITIQTPVGFMQELKKYNYSY